MQLRNRLQVTRSLIGPRWHSPVDLVEGFRVQGSGALECRVSCLVASQAGLCQLPSVLCPAEAGQSARKLHNTPSLSQATGIVGDAGRVHLGSPHAIGTQTKTSPVAKQRMHHLSTKVQLNKDAGQAKWEDQVELATDRNERRGLAAGPFTAWWGPSVEMHGV